MKHISLYVSLFILIIIMMAVIAIAVQSQQQQRPIIIREAPKIQEVHRPVTHSEYILNKSVSRLVNPLMPPERTPAGGPIPVSIPTRGYPSQYQQVGVLKPQADAPNVYLQNHMLLPLFGRQTYSGSSNWNYYSGNDSTATIKLPVIRNDCKRDCLANVGCRELYDNDIVQVRGLPGTYQVQLYQMDTPRYHP